MPEGGRRQYGRNRLLRGRCRRQYGRNRLREGRCPRSGAPDFQPVFSVYNFVDEKAAQCTILSQNRTLSPFFDEEIVHIETLMRDAMTAGHVSRPLPRTWAHAAVPRPLVGRAKEPATVTGIWSLIAGICFIRTKRCGVSGEVHFRPIPYDSGRFGRLVNTNVPFPAETHLFFENRSFGREFSA